MDKLKTTILDSSLLQCVFSSPMSKETLKKISIRKILIKNKAIYQVTYHHKKIIHKNLSVEECLRLVQELLPQYKQIHFNTEKENFHLMQNKKGTVTVLKKPAQNDAAKTLPHNRTKKTVLKEDSSVPFLVELGVMTSAGKIVSGKRDKFRQINRFLELVADIVFHLPKEKTLRIIDFGCGKAYLTFALYHYLQDLGYSFNMIGLDLQEDIVKSCQSIADKLQFSNLLFLQGDIQSYSGEDSVDLVVCLHACNTATDAALKKAIEWKTKVIMAVPCCQHELFKQIKCPSLHPLLKHGILKERLAALATDAARAQYLEIVGYKTQVFEFIDMEHTPKNLMIRAVRQDHPKNKEKLIEELESFKQLLNISPAIDAPPSS